MAIAALPELPLEWSGEYFDRTQGAFYVRLGLKDFATSRETRFMTGGVEITIVNLLNQKEYRFHEEPRGEASAPRKVWKLPAGKYAVRLLEVVDTAGRKRSLSAPSRDQRTFVVKRQCLSNLGVWTLAPLGRDGLAATYAMAPNTYSEEIPRQESSIAAIIDGFTGLIQMALGGKKVLEGVQNQYGSKRELRHTLRFSRTISMFFKLNLFRDNSEAKAIAQVLGASDTAMRGCYTSALDDYDNLDGDVKFTFLLSKDTGTMSKLKHTGGSIKDAKMVRCLYMILGQMQFPLSKSMVGEVTYMFEAK